MGDKSITGKLLAIYWLLSIGAGVVGAGFLTWKHGQLYGYVAWIIYFGLTMFPALCLDKS